jgi:hypothetical protein
MRLSVVSRGKVIFVLRSLPIAATGILTLTADDRIIYNRAFLRTPSVFKIKRTQCSPFISNHIIATFVGSLRGVPVSATSVLV